MKLQIFLINMKKDVERLDFMSSQLKRNGMDFYVQEGLDGRTYDFSGIYIKPETNFTLAEKGCALSHKLALEKFISGGADYGLFLEDDVELPDNFRRIVDKQIDDSLSGLCRWDYLSFNYPAVGLRFIHLWLFLLYRLFIDKPSIKLYLKLPIFCLKFLFIIFISLFEGGREFIYKIIYPQGRVSRFLRPLYLAGCYLVTKEGAKKLLETQSGLSFTADRLPNVARIRKGLKFRALVPLLVRQRRDKFKSNIMINEKYFFNN